MCSGGMWDVHTPFHYRTLRPRTHLLRQGGVLRVTTLLCLNPAKSLEFPFAQVTWSRQNETVRARGWGEYRFNKLFAGVQGGAARLWLEKHALQLRTPVT